MIEGKIERNARKTSAGTTISLLLPFLSKPNSVAGVGRVSFFASLGFCCGSQHTISATPQCACCNVDSFVITAVFYDYLQTFFM